MRWTDKDIELLNEMYAQKASIEEIAAKLNRTPHAVRNKAHKMKITNSNSYSEYEKQYIKENYKSYNLQEIAEKLGRDKHNICRYARQAGLERTRKKKENPKTFTDENGNSHPVGWVRKTHEERSKARQQQMTKWLKEHPEEAKKRGQQLAAWRAKNGHPRCMTGKQHSEEAKLKMSKKSKDRWHNLTKQEINAIIEKQLATRKKNGTLNPNAFVSNPYSRTKSGKRADLNNVFFRSAWEANVARYFNFLGLRWEYEPRVFYFEGVKRGTMSYTPDFYLVDRDLWVEVKGWMDNKSKVKLKRFAKYYPNENLEIIGQREYREIEKNYSALILHWEQ